MKKLDRARATMACEGGYEALRSMLKGEYTEESTGARTIRQTGGKDRHSKVFTARGPRDRRVRLSVATAIRFYDLQDRLGFEQPSKAVEWLLLHCQPSIQALPQLASLHPVRVTTISQPAAYVVHHPHTHTNKGQEPYKDEQRIHHQNREQNFDHYNYTANHHCSLEYSGPFPSCDNHLQDSIDEDLSQYSNPCSSGASSDHPLSLSEVARPQCKVTLPEAIPITANHTASSASMHQCSASITPSPAVPINQQMNKRHRMQYHLQNHGGDARFASSGSNGASISLSVGRPLDINNGLSSQMSCSSFGNTANFNRLMINDEDALLMSKVSLQGQLSEDMQHMMRLPSLACKPNQYVDVAQQLFTAQATQLASDFIVQGASNQSAYREADTNGQARTSSISAMNDTMQLYNKIALQQVDELVCSNVYASPSPSESTSINTLAAAYSKASNINMVDGQLQAANILYTPSWNPSSGLQ